MTTSDLHTMYSYLTAEERFRLVLAASSRGDFAERDRLSAASKRIELTMQDYAPWAHAFTELAMIIFMEMVEIACKHRDAMRAWFNVVSSLEQEEASDEDDTADEPPVLPDHDEMSEDERFEVKLLGTAFGIGFILNTKIAGWKLFCERMNVPAFTIWKSLPGYERLEKTMAKVNETNTETPTAFRAEHMMEFLQNNRPEGFPEPTEDGLMTADKVAKALDSMFRDMVKQHGG